MRPSLTLSALLLAATVSCQSTDAGEGGELREPAEPTAAAPEPEPEPEEQEGPESPPAVVGTEEAAAAAPSAQDGIQEDLQGIELRRQRRQALAQRYLEQGEDELERADLDAALQSFATALELDPTSQEARDRLRRVEALMGDRYSTAAEQLTDETEQAIVRRAQAQLQAEFHTNAGDRALAEGRYDDAIASYRQAQIILGYHPYIATGSLDEQLVQGRLDTAIARREEARAQTEAASRDEARRLRELAEQQERERREAKLREYYARANEAFLNEDFKQAEVWASMVLIEDPGNEAAMQLKDTAAEARHYRADALNRRHYREQWLRTIEELDTMDVPQTEPLVFNDLKRWREVLQRQPLEHGQTDSAGSRERQEILERLETVTLPVDFGQDGQGAPIDEVAAFLQRVTGINFWVSPAVLEELDVEQTEIDLHLPERSVRKVLDLIAETKRDLFWKIEDGLVKFVTAAEMTGGQILRNYSVQDLLHPINDYPAREINISPSGGLLPLDDDPEPREANILESGVLEDLIRAAVAPASWDEDGNTIVITDTGTLVVKQTPEVHAKIQALLEDLREATGIMVDIQARFMKVEDNFLEDIGVDFRGLGQPGLGSSVNFNDFGDASTLGELGGGIGQDSSAGAFYDEGEDGDLRARTELLYDASLGDDQVLQASGGFTFQWTFLNDLQLQLILRAVSKSERVELVTAPGILVHNAARANLSVMNQVAYVQDFDVEIAQAASIADPIIAVIQDGVILDVRPVVSADRRFITLELRPTVAELRRPIREKATTLGSQSSVTIQLPEVEIQRVRTSIPMPDGGTVLLGGMKISEKKDFASGVPILNKIPLLTALFERKGNYVSNRKLLILLRARVIIPSEIEPTPAELGPVD